MRGLKAIGKEIVSRGWTGMKRAGVTLRSWASKFWGGAHRQAGEDAREVGKEVRKKIIGFIAQVIFYLFGALIILAAYFWGINPAEWVEKIKNPAVPHTFTGFVEDKETGEGIPGMVVGIEGYSKRVTTTENGKYEITIRARRSKDNFYVRVLSNEEYKTQSKGKPYPSRKGPCIIDFQLEKVAAPPPSLTRQ